MDNDRIIGLLHEVEEGVMSDDFLVRDYSGRGMYGRRCLGVFCPDALAGLQLAVEGLTELVGDLDELRDLIESLGEPRSDQMGFGQVLYWPGVAWPED